MDTAQRVLSPKMPSFAELLRAASTEAPPLDDAWGARRRLAAALRRLVEATTTRDGDAETYVRIAARAEALASELESQPRRAGLLANTGTGGVERFAQVAQELNPLYGLSNPLAPPLEMWRDDTRAWGRVRFGWAYEGPPGHVHGGHVAAVFDQFLGFAQCLVGATGMTGKLEVRYVRPTRLDRELVLEAHVKERAGRLTYVEGRLLDDGAITAKAKAMFVDVASGYLSR